MRILVCLAAIYWLCHFAGPYVETNAVALVHGLVDSLGVTTFLTPTATAAGSVSAPVATSAWAS